MSRDLNEYYYNEYLTSPTVKESSTNPKNVLVENTEFDDFDLEEPLEETYYAGGDEGDGRNKGVNPKISKKTGKKSTKKESFRALAESILNEEFNDFDDDGGFDDFDDAPMDDDGSFGDEPVSVPASVIRDLIATLEGVLGDVEGGEDDFDDFDDEGFEDEGFEDDFVDDEDPFEGDEFPKESWDGGNGDQRLKGDYSGKQKPLAKSNLHDRSKVKTGYRPGPNGGGSGDQRMKGNYSGKAAKGKSNCSLSNKGKAKTNFKGTSSVESDLFGA